MRTKIRVIVKAGLTLGTALFLVGGPFPQSQPRPKTALTASMMDTPKITDFSAAPPRVARGMSTVLKWRVEPGPGGSPIASIRIARTEGLGPTLSLRPRDPIGEHTLAVPAGVPKGRTTYALTAVNGAGLSALKTLSLEIIDPPDLVVKEIGSTGLAVGFTVTNRGEATFRGRISLRVAVNGAPGIVGPDRFREIRWVEDGLYEVRDIQIPPGVDVRFRLLDPESHSDGWYSGTYPISVRISTSEPTEDPGNNERAVTLSHSGVRRGVPALDLYILKQPELLASAGSSLWREVKFIVFNTGPGDAVDVEWEIRIVDADQARRGEPGMRIRSGKVGRLAPGSTEVSVDQDLGLTVDKPMLLRIILDPEDKIFEKDETNNRRELAFVIHR